MSPRIVFFNRPNLDKIVPDQSYFDPPDCRHILGAKVRAGIRQRPDRDPLLARTIAILGRCSAENGLSQLERGRFVPMCGRFLPFFSRFSCKSVRMLTQVAESKQF